MQMYMSVLWGTKHLTKCVRKIKDEDKLTVLKMLEKGEMTFSEAASDIKQLQPIHESFIKEMGLTTRKDAEETFPEYTVSERLRQFVGIDSQNLTEEFLVIPCLCHKSHLTDLHYLPFTLCWKYLTPTHVGLVPEISYTLILAKALLVLEISCTFTYIHVTALVYNTGILQGSHVIWTEL